MNLLTPASRYMVSYEAAEEPVRVRFELVERKVIEQVPCQQMEAVWNHDVVMWQVSRAGQI